MFKEMLYAAKAEWLVLRTSPYMFVRWSLPIAGIAAIGSGLNIYRNLAMGSRPDAISLSVVAIAVLVFAHRIIGWMTKQHLLDRYTVQELEATKKNIILQEMRSAAASNGWRLDQYGSGEALTHPAQNRLICQDGGDPKVNLLPSPWHAWSQYNDDLRKFTIHRAVRKTGELWNDGKIRIASDFAGTAAPVVDLQLTDYLSSLMTDQYRWGKVRSTRTAPDGATPESTLWEGPAAIWREGAVGTQARIVALAESPTSNQLGASTFAFSSDGYLMLVLQKAINHQSPGTIAPSGSGSFDWADISASNAMSLYGLARFGAERELREECALDDLNKQRFPIRSRLMLYSFVRMVHRVGKPEFYALAQIDATAAAIRARKPERYVEQVVMAGAEPIRLVSGRRPSIEIAAACKNYLNLRYADSTGKYLPMSYPLEHGLHLLIEACISPDSSAAIDSFWVQHFPQSS